MPLKRLPIRQRLEQTDTWLLELFLGLYQLVWGLGFANPFTETFAANPRAYALLSALPGGEMAFGMATVVLGLAAVNGVFYGARSSRSLLMGICGLYWLAIAISIGIPTSWAAGGIPQFTLAGGSCWYCAARMRRRAVL